MIYFVTCSVCSKLKDALANDRLKLFVFLFKKPAMGSQSKTRLFKKAEGLKVQGLRLIVLSWPDLRDYDIYSLIELDLELSCPDGGKSEFEPYECVNGDKACENDKESFERKWGENE